VDIRSQCVAVWCSVLQCGAVCCSAVQCVAVWCSALQCVAVWCSILAIGRDCSYYRGEPMFSFPRLHVSLGRKPYTNKAYCKKYLAILGDCCLLFVYSCVHIYIL